MKRFFSLLLVLVMVFSMIPQAAFADDTCVDSGVSLVLGDNALTLDSSAAATAYYFEPAETGVYTFTGPEGSVVGISGYFWVTGMPDSTTNSCEWTCGSVGQGVYIGVSADGESVNVNITKTAEYVDTSIQWTTYVNQYNPADYGIPCFTTEGVEGYGDYTMVNFNHASLSIVGMLSNGSARYSDVEAGIYIDYTAALQEYVTASEANGYYFYLTPDLEEMLANLYTTGWDYQLSSWTDLLVYVKEEHTAETVTKTDEAGYTYVYCGDCGFMLDTTAPGFFESNPIIVEFTMNDEWTAGTATVTVQPGEGWWYGAYTMGMNLTIDGEEVETAANPRVPTTFYLANPSDEAVTFELALYTPAPEAGSFENPAELVIGENTAEIAADSWGYYYNYVATEDGTLTITMPEGDWSYYTVDVATGSQSDMQWSDSDPVVNPAVLEVTAGNTYQVVVNTYDPAAWSTPAGTITFTAAFEKTVEIPETLAEQLAEAAQLANGEYLPYITTAQGKVVAIEEYSAQFGNITFEFSADGNSVDCYRVAFEGMETLAVGDTVKVEGYLTAYKNDPQFDNTATVTIIEKAPVEEPTETADAMIDFSDVSQRVSQDSNAQVWANNGITLTNNKAGSTTNVANYYNPVRFYKNTELVIEYPGMTKLVFTCGSSDYANVLVTSLGEGATAEGAVVTYVPAEATDSITFTASAQFRVKTLEVYADTTGGEDGACEHVIEHVAESCYNTEHWYCTECLTYWADADLIVITNSKNVIKAAPTHVAEHTAESCYNTEYWYCAACDTYFADEALTQVTNSKNVMKAEPHNAEHVEENCWAVEHWYCADCEGYWLDEALTQVTNSKNIMKAEVSHEAEHVEESCYNTEYWYCAICETYWVDEALTQITNSKNVNKAEPTHILEHVEAVEATCVEEGNIEYWYCTACETVWQDEALTQITNHKNVITPVDEDAHEWGKWETTKEATCTAKGKQIRECELDEEHTQTRDIAKLDHVDKDKDEECDDCEADLSNSKTGDMIMISVVVMLLAAAAIVVLLTKKRNAA